MKHVIAVLFAFLILSLPQPADAREKPPESFQEAVELIHAFSGAGNELQRATQIIESLSKAHPNKGYGRALRAEMLSVWNLDQQGGPAPVFAQILSLVDEALRFNPDLAQAYVARGRALLRASKYDDARKAIDKALELDAAQAGAMFLRAEMYRRTGKVADAETWYLRFIEATPSLVRKSNAYYWLGRAYGDSAWDHPTEWPSLMPKARAAYQKMVDLDPNGAWKNVNFAIFLNNEAGDFDEAERYAAKALSIMKFPMARYHLAIARYQKLLRSLSSVDDRELQAAVADVYSSTGISFEDAFAFASQYDIYVGIRGRLMKIRARLNRN
jgi:tetratricopeptide (TPR) repeat protein